MKVSDSEEEVKAPNIETAPDICNNDEKCENNSPKETTIESENSKTETISENDNTEEKSDTVVTEEPEPAVVKVPEVLPVTESSTLEEPEVEETKVEEKKEVEEKVEEKKEVEEEKEVEEMKEVEEDKEEEEEEGDEDGDLQLKLDTSTDNATEEPSENNTEAVVENAEVEKDVEIDNVVSENAAIEAATAIQQSVEVLQPVIVTDNKPSAPVEEPAETVQVCMEALLKPLNKHLKRAVNRLKDDHSKFVALKQQLGDLVQEVMLFSTDAEKLEGAVENAVLKFEITGKFAASSVTSVKTMQLDSELSLDELVNYLTDEIENEYRKAKAFVPRREEIVVAPIPEIAELITAKDIPIPSSIKSPEKLLAPPILLPAGAENVPVSNAEITVAEDPKQVLIDKSKLFSEMEDKFEKETQSALKSKPVHNKKKSESESSEAKIILMKEPGELELTNSHTIPEVVVNINDEKAMEIDDPSPPFVEMILSPGARSDGAMDREVESENESVSPTIATQSSELIKSLRKVRVKRSRNSSSNNHEFDSVPLSMMAVDIDTLSPPRLIRPRLLMSPPNPIPEMSASQASPLLFSSLQIEIPNSYQRAGPMSSSRLTPRMSPAANTKRIEVSPTVLSKVDAETAAGAVQVMLLSPRFSSISIPQPPPLGVITPALQSPASLLKFNGELSMSAFNLQKQQQQQQHQQQLPPKQQQQQPPKQQHQQQQQQPLLQQQQQPQQQQQQQQTPEQPQQPQASLKTVIRVPKALPAATSTAGSAATSNSSFTSSLVPSSSPEFSKKKRKSKNLSFMAESDGGVDTAEEEEFQEQFQRKKQRNKHLQISDTEYDGKSADESNTDGGGKQSPDSGGMGSSSKSVTDEKLAE